MLGENMQGKLFLEQYSSFLLYLPSDGELFEWEGVNQAIFTALIHDVHDTIRDELYEEIAWELNNELVLEENKYARS